MVCIILVYRHKYIKSRETLRFSTFPICITKIGKQTMGSHLKCIHTTFRIYTYISIYIHISSSSFYLYDNFSNSWISFHFGYYLLLFFANYARKYSCFKNLTKNTPKKYAPFPLTQWAKSGKKCNTKCVFGQKSTILKKKHPSFKTLYYNFSVF